MKNPPLLILAALITAVLALFFALFLLPQPAPPAPKESETPGASIEVTRRYADLTGSSATPPASDPKETAEPASSTQISSTAAATPSGKQENLDVIWQTMSTFSEEGLPVLQPYLSNPDPEIRSAAVEAIKQLAVPAGADVLRAAAKDAKTTREQIEMLEAAEFLELPRLPVSVLKELMETGKLKLPSKSGQQATNAPVGN